MAGKASLHEYQRNLSARLANLEAGRAASRLGLQVGVDRWLVDLDDAGEVIPVPPITAVPLTRAWFAGVANIRGTLYSVIDFPAFLGGAPAAATDQARLLLIGEKYRMNSGLLIDRVLGLYRDEQLQRDDATPSPWTAAQYIDKQNNRWKQLNVRELVAHSDFLQVGI
ncbi:MAG TPA: chemotaxis protein CheW [Burkholderiales bacterium]|nr:chemotaxis protein CheW [Burkholderiales bacterium]